MKVQRCPSAHLQQEAINYTATHAKANIVEFASSLFYCAESEPSVKVDVTRLGESPQPVTVEYATRDGSAKDGEKFIGVNGMLSFEPGEKSKSIEIALIGSDAFENDLEFEVRVLNPIGCKVGEYLQVCRVLIVDDDTYPSNKWEAKVQTHRIWSIPSWPLFFDFMHTSIQSPVIKRACIRNAIADQCMNFKYLVTVYLMNYLIDDLLREGSDRQDESWLTKLFFSRIPGLANKIFVLVVLSLLPHLVILCVKRAKAKRRIQGMVIDSMQCNITRKFLSYDENSRHMAAEADLLMAMTRDVTHLVHSGFVACFEITEKAGLLLILMITAFSQRGGMPAWTAGLLFTLHPVVMIVFLLNRKKGIESRREAADSTATDVVRYFQQLTSCYRLIADYGQKPLAVATFDGHVKAANDAAKEAHIYEIVNLEFAPFLTTLFSGLYIICQFQNVLDGAPLGQFITGLAIWRTIGQCYESMYHDYLLMHDVMAPLRNIVHYLNLPSEAPGRMALHRKVLAEGQEAWKGAREELKKSADKEMEEHCYALDRLSFKVRDLTFNYPQFTGGTQVLSHSHLEFAMGNLVAITGPRGGGKATLLELLGGVLLPECTDDGPLPVFVPPHLRVLHVSREPMAFADLSIFENLTFGPSDGDDEAMSRVISICRRLGVSDQVLGMIEAGAMPLGAQPSPHKPPPSGDVEHANDGAPLLSETNKCLLHLARAFVMNPEVLIVHKPLSHFDDLHSRLVVELLREFVDLRGIEKPIEGYGSRRRRTCIFSCESSKATHNCVDLLYYVGNGKIELLHEEMMNELKIASRELFNSIDINSDNTVGLPELVAAIKRAPWNGELLGLTKEQLSGPEEMLDHGIQAIFERVDHSHNGDVDFEELVEYLRNRFQDDLPRVLEALRNYKEADALMMGLQPTDTTEAETNGAQTNGVQSQEVQINGVQQVESSGIGWAEPPVPKELPMLGFSRRKHGYSR